MKDLTATIVTLLIVGGGGVLMTWRGINLMTSNPGFRKLLEGFGFIGFGVLGLSFSVFLIYGYATTD